MHALKTQTRRSPEEMRVRLKKARQMVVASLAPATRLDEEEKKPPALMD